MAGYGINLLGGVLIGLSASGMLLANGRVTGISGIFAGALFTRTAESSWRYMFLLGLLLGGLVLVWFFGFQFDPLLDRSLAGVAIGGLLVGLGTNLGSGCTSGHGVCGISRMSPRSILATGLFMFSGFVSTYLLQHVIGGI